MNHFLKILLSLSLSGTLLTLLLLLLKQLYKNRFSKCWQYYIWLAAALRFLLPFTPGHAPVSTLFQAAETAATARMARLSLQEAQGTVSETGSTSQSAGRLADSSHSSLNNGISDTDRFLYADSQNDSTNSSPDSSISDTGRPAGRTDTAVQKAAPYSRLSRNLHWISACIFFAWLLPALGLFFRRVCAYWGFVRHIRTEGTAVSDIRLLNLLAACEEACGIQRPVELYYHPQPASPVMTGFFHPCIAIPRSRMSDSTLAFIFMHELTHYKRRDLFYKWLIQAAVCIHWFNPFIRLLEQETGRACELSCDEAVVRSLNIKEKTAYGDTLLMCSRIIPAGTASSLTLTEGAKQLKERLGAIMNEQKRTKKTTAAAAAVTAGICLGSFLMGGYAAPAAPYAKPGQSLNDTRQDGALPDRHAAAKNPSALPDTGSLPDTMLSKYRSLLAFQTDTYQDMTIDSFREHAVSGLDTPQGMQLLYEAAREDSIRFSRFTDKDAFFLYNTLLPLTSGVWKTSHITSAGAERPLQNGQTAELEFNATVKILNRDIKISEYEQAYRGLYQAAQSFLSSQTEAVLADASASSCKKVQKQAEKALEKYAAAVSQNGNIRLSIDRCLYGPEGPAVNPKAGKPEFAETTSSSIPAYIRQVLSLKTNGYQDRKLKDFYNDVTQQYENDPSLWEAKNRLFQKGCSQLKSQLSEEDYLFLTVTLPCTESESDYPRDRTGNLPPDFSRQYDLPYPELRTSVHFEWCVRYEPADPELTVGQRDALIINIIHGMDAFMADTPEHTDIGSTAYQKKMRQRLKQLIKENSGRGLDMTIFQCG